MIPTLHIQLLGNFLIRADDTPVTTVDSPRLQALLAYLVLHRDAPQPRPHLAFRLWPDTTEAQAHTNLRTLLHRLRRALPEADHFLHVDAQTVHWRSDAPFTLDVADFERAMAQADQAERAGDQAGLRVALQEAVALYRGDLLPGCYDEWMLPERERLSQMFIAALERLIPLLEGERDYPAAINAAQRLLRHDPLHEATYGHLMRLHVLGGDRASALRVYHTCATVLERELAVAPSPATREAYEDLLRQGTSTGPPVGRPAPPSPARRHNLPIPLTSFIGRAHELAEVKQLLRTTRLLTLTGAGGCGKSRLALAVATDLMGEYPDEAWLVELAALADPALLPQAVATTLGLREEPQRPLTATLVDALQPRAMLLVLDNCEHLIEACAHLAHTLLSACPQLQIVATSREALGLAGETAWLVPSLSLPKPRPLPSVEQLTQSEAVQLFVERAGAALPTFVLTDENASAVAEVCQRADGIPLAIELAAARVKLLSVAQITERLDDCLRLLTGGSRTALPRHQTLRAAMDWSYALLSEPERALFRRLAVFAGGWTLEAAETVCAGAGLAANEILEWLAHLVDKSLVVVDTRAGEAARYRLLETIRQYAGEKLLESGEVARVQGRHLDFLMKLAEEAEPKLYDARQVAWLDRLEAELDNFRAAFEWLRADNDAESEMRLAGELWRFWVMRGYWNEGYERLKKTLSRNGSVSAGVRVKARYRAGELALRNTDLAAANTLFGESLALCRELGDKIGIAFSLYGFGRLAQFQRDFAAARSLFEESLTIYRELEDKWGIAVVLDRLSFVAAAQSDLASARLLADEALAIFRNLGDYWDMARALHNQGERARWQGDYARAKAFYEEAKALGRKLGMAKWDLANQLAGLGYVAQREGDYERAKLLFKESLVLYKEQGIMPFGPVVSLAGLGGVVGAQGQPVRAARLLGAAEAMLEATGDHMEPQDRAEYDRDAAAVRAQLDEAAFAAAWAEGRAMTLEQAIAEALRVADELTARTPEALVSN